MTMNSPRELGIPLLLEMIFVLFIIEKTSAKYRPAHQTIVFQVDRIKKNYADVKKIRTNLSSTMGKNWIPLIKLLYNKHRYGFLMNHNQRHGLLEVHLRVKVSSY